MNWVNENDIKYEKPEQNTVQEGKPFKGRMFKYRE